MCFCFIKRKIHTHIAGSQGWPLAVAQPTRSSTDPSRSQTGPGSPCRQAAAGSPPFRAAEQGLLFTTCLDPFYFHDSIYITFPLAAEMMYLVGCGHSTETVYFAPSEFGPLSVLVKTRRRTCPAVSPIHIPRVDDRAAAQARQSNF